LVLEDVEAPRDLRALRKLELPVELKDKGRRHHILEHAYRALPAAERGLLGRLSLYRTVIDVPMLQVFDGMYPLKETLRKLVIRGFVEREELLIDMHPVVRQFARQQLIVTDPSEVAPTHRMMADFYRTETGEELKDEFLKVAPQDERYVGPLREDADGFGSIDDVAPTIELVYHLLKCGDMDHAIVMLRDRLSHLLVYKFYAFRILKDLLDPAFLDCEGGEPASPTNDKQAWALNILGNCYRYCVSSCKAAVLHETVVRWDEQNAENLFSIRLVNLAIDQELIGDFLEAEKNFKHSLAIARRLEIWSNVVSCLRELGRLYTRAGKFSEAGKFLAEALQLARELGSRYLPAVLINHSHLYLVQGDVSLALEVAREAERASIAIQERKLMDERRAIAACLMATGTPEDHAEAGRLLREALDEAGRDELAAMQLQLLLALAQWLGYGPEALRLAKRALNIAVDGDYVTFEADARATLGEIEMAQGNLSLARQHGNLAMVRSSQRKDPRTRAYVNLPSGHALRYGLGQRRAAELLKHLQNKDV
jgi:tetratricopeptide (TPR) repeat protein